MKWVKRNTAALIALVVLVPATAIVVGGYEWWDYFSGRPVIAIEPDAQRAPGVVTLEGTNFGPALGEVHDAPAFDTPEGTRVVEVRLPIEPGEVGSGCFAPTLRELSTGRQWNEGSLRITGPTMLTTSCQGEDVLDPYELELYYLIPADAQEPLTLDLTVPHVLPEFLRIPVQLRQ